MQRSFKGLTTALLIACTSLVFVACGGGGGNDGGGAAVAFRANAGQLELGIGGGQRLLLAQEPSYGVVNTTSFAQTTSAFQLQPAAPSPTLVVSVLPNDFAAAGAGEANFIELQFNKGVDVASVFGNGGAGSAGIVVRDSAGAFVSYFLDTAGAIDATNEELAPGIAPARLRVYFEDAATPGVPVALQPDKYTLSIFPGNLRSFDGNSFCVVEDNGLCMNDTNCVYRFTLDSLNAPGGPAPLASGPTVALPLPQVAQIDDEIRLFFDDHVDFQSIVGFNPATNLLNSTTQDPFVSQPIQLGNNGGSGENITVQLNLGNPNAVVPPNYGYIVYMPNPFKDSSEVRIRFVDLTNLVGIDDPMGMLTGGTPLFQNYALPSVVWESARLATGQLTPPSDINPSSMTFGQSLQLPPKLPLLGSNNGFTNTFNVTLLSENNANANDSSVVNPNAQDGVLGVTDRARRALGADIAINRNVGPGPAIANNPELPDLHLIANGNRIDGVSSAAVTANGISNGILTGRTFRIPAPFDDPTTITSVDDIIYSNFMVNPANSPFNPPRRSNHAGVVAQNMDPGVPFPPGGNTEDSEFGLINGMPQPVPQPLGGRAYVLDGVRGIVTVLNTNTFQPLGQLTGLSSPRGLGISGSFLYVSGFDQNTISQVGVNPAIANNFHQVIQTTAVGPGPTIVTVQTAGEDVIVLNSLANSISFVDVPTFSERAQFAVGLGSTEITAANRFTCMGCTLAYQAYIPNRLDGTVTIYESDSPLPGEPNGMQGVILQAFGGFAGPDGACSPRGFGASQTLGGDGAMVADAGGNSVKYVQFQSFSLAPPPGFPGVPASRVFYISADYPVNPASGPSDVCMDAFTFFDEQQGAFTQRLMLVLSPGPGEVAAVDWFFGINYGTTSVPGNKIFGFFDQ